MQEENTVRALAEGFALFEIFVCYTIIFIRHYQKKRLVKIIKIIKRSECVQCY